MDKFVLIAPQGIERLLWCEECKEDTPHHIHMVAVNLTKHTVKFTALCKECLAECEESDDIIIRTYIFTIDDWEELIDIDPMATDITQN